MQRLKLINKFYRRYEVDLWGRVGFQRSNKTVKFLSEVYRDKLRYTKYKKTEKNPKQVKRLKKHYNNKIKVRKRVQKNSVHGNLSNKLLLQSSNLNSINQNKQSLSNTNQDLEISNKIINDKKIRTPFFYKLYDVAPPKRKRARTSLARNLFVMKTKLLRFYANIKKYQLRRYAKVKSARVKFKLQKGMNSTTLLKFYSTATRRKLMAVNAFLSLIEHRLDITLYRSNFVCTMQQARQFINHKHVFVNNQIVSHTNYLLHNYDVISLNSKMKKYVTRTYLNYQKLKIVLYPPRYIYADYTLLIAMIVSNPNSEQVPFPFSINLKKWLGLAKYTLS